MAYLSPKPKPIKENSVLVFDLTRSINDAPEVLDFGMLLESSLSEEQLKRNSLREIIDGIDRAAKTHESKPYSSKATSTPPTMDQAWPHLGTP